LRTPNWHFKNALIMLTFLTQAAMWCTTLGFILAFLSWRNLVYYQNVRKYGTKTEGIVIQMRPDPGPLFGEAKVGGEAPTVEFTDKQGNKRQYICVCYQDPSPYKVGQKLAIWYYIYRSRQEFALEDDYADRSTATLLKVGLVMMLLGAGVFLKRLSGFF
jgi:hypothetical protein